MAFLGQRSIGAGRASRPLPGQASPQGMGLSSRGGREFSMHYVLLRLQNVSQSCLGLEVIKLRLQPRGAVPALMAESRTAFSRNNFTDSLTFGSVSVLTKVSIHPTPKMIQTFIDILAEPPGKAWSGADLRSQVPSNGGLWWCGQSDTGPQNSEARGSKRLCRRYVAGLSARCSATA